MFIFLHNILSFIDNFSLKITHIHANNFGESDQYGNPTVLEMTFEKSPVTIGTIFSIPNKLDYKNNPNSEDFNDYLEE